MSKSMGNIIRPAEVLEKYGSDAFRLWAAGETGLGDDFRISDERIGGAQKFLTKLHNVARFISAFPEVRKPATLHPTDEWILAELDAIVAKARPDLEEFGFFEVATGLRSFVWNLFAPHYLELAKARAYAGDSSAVHTLHHCLRSVLRLLAPISPVLPFAVWSELYKGDIHRERLPDPVGAFRRPEVGEKILEFNSQMWKLKKERGLSFSSPLEGVQVPVDLVEFASDLKSMHRIA
jgi:valyl-tRNA synthetase